MEVSFSAVKVRSTTETSGVGTPEVDRIWVGGLFLFFPINLGILDLILRGDMEHLRKDPGLFSRIGEL